MFYPNLEIPIKIHGAVDIITYHIWWHFSWAYIKVQMFKFNVDNSCGHG